MLQIFRRFFGSRLGVALTLGLIGLIALAFAAADVVGNGGLGHIGRSTDIAVVGKDKIDAAQFTRAMSSALEQARQQNPQATMKTLIAEGAAGQVLDSLIDRAAIVEFGRSHGIVAGKRLVDSELTKIPGLQGLDGKFSEATYRQLLTQRRLTDAEVRGDIAQGLVARQVALPAQFGAGVPAGIVQYYASLLAEHRTGAIGIIPAAAFAPRTPPAESELTTWFAAHRQDFLRPERRVIRWATFGDAALKDSAAPTDAEIAARYAADKAKYVASESRRLTQLVLPTEAAARAVLAEVEKGTALAAAARAKGLATAAIGPLDRAAYAEQSSTAAADAVFGAANGKLVGPVKGSLGWLLVRVDEVQARPARSLDQVRGEIGAALAAEKRKAALADLAVKISDGFDKGGNLAEAARDLGVTIQTSPPLTADGRVYGQPGQAAPAALTAPVVQAAFAMEREQAPQLAEAETGKTFLIFDVDRIETAAVPPLAEVRQAAIAGLQLEKGVAAARAAAMKALAQAKKGSDLSAALAGLGVPLPAPQPVSMSRQQLAANGTRVPPPLGLMFAMAQGTTKLLPAPRNAGWFIVQLKAIEPGKIAPGSPLLADTANELAQLTGGEYVEALRKAIRAEVGVQRHDDAFKAALAQIPGAQ